MFSIKCILLKVNFINRQIGVHNNIYDGRLCIIVKVFSKKSVEMTNLFVDCPTYKKNVENIEIRGMRKLGTGSIILNIIS